MGFIRFNSIQSTFAMSSMEAANVIIPSSKFNATIKKKKKQQKKIQNKKQKILFPIMETLIVTSAAQLVKTVCSCLLTAKYGNKNPSC